jgi:hypothetical protein
VDRREEVTGTFTVGIVCCRGCKAHQTDMSDDDNEDRTSKRLSDVKCGRCGYAGCYWLDRQRRGLTKEQAKVALTTLRAGP